MPPSASGVVWVDVWVGIVRVSPGHVIAKLVYKFYAPPTAKRRGSTGADGGVIEQYEGEQGKGTFR